MVQVIWRKKALKDLEVTGGQGTLLQATFCCSGTYKET